MIIHWLINIFQDPLMSYLSAASIEVQTLYGIVFGYGLATLFLIPWVRFFSRTWLPHQDRGSSEKAPFGPSPMPPA